MARERDNDTEEILVKVGRSGGRVEEYSLEEGATIADALEAAGITTSKGDRIRLNGESADEEETLEDGDIITIAGKVAGASN